MKKMIFVLLVFINSLIANNITPKESIEVKKNLNTKNKQSLFDQILVFEGLLLINAWMASQNPHFYGGFGILLFPMGTNTKSKSSMVGLLTTEALAIYNLTINKSKKFKKDIFKENFIGWHLIGLINYFAGNFDDNIQVKPTKKNDGVLLQYSYRF